MAAPSTIKYPDKRGKWRVRARPVPKRGQQAGGRWYWRFEGWLPGDKPWAARPAAWMTEDEVLAEVSRLYLSEEWLLQRPGEETSEGGGGPPVVLWQLVQEWLKHLKTLPSSECSEGSRRIRRSHANRLLYETRGQRRAQGRPVHWKARAISQEPLDKLCEDTFRKHVRRRLAAGAAPNSVAGEMEVVWLASRWGRKKGWCQEVSRWRLSRERSRPRVTPDDEWVAELLPYLSTHGSGWAAVAVLVGVMAGLRIDEIGNLGMEQVRECEVLLQTDASQPARYVPGMMFEVKVSKTKAREVLLLDPMSIERVRAWIASPRRQIQGGELLMQRLQSEGRSMELREFSEPGPAAIRINAHMRRLEGEGMLSLRALPQAVGEPFRVLYTLTEAGKAWSPPPNPSPYLLGVTPHTARTVNRYIAQALDELNAVRREVGMPEIPRWTSHANRRRCMHRTIATGKSDPAGHKAQFGNTWRVAIKDYVLENRVDASRVAALVPGLPEAGKVLPFNKASSD